MDADGRGFNFILHLPAFPFPAIVKTAIVLRMTVAIIKRQALALKPAQRLRLVQDLWDSFVAEPRDVQIPDEHKRLIDQRLAEHQADPDSAITLAEAKRRLRVHMTRKTITGRRKK